MTKRELITNARCFRRERRNQIYLQFQGHHTSPGGTSLPTSPKDPSSQSRCLGTHGRNERAEVWETEGAKASQRGSTTMSLGRGNQPPRSPPLPGGLLPRGDRVTLCPRGDRATRRAATSRNTGWKGTNEDGTKGEERGEAHPCADEKLGACFSKINAWPSELDILPPQAARTLFLPWNEPPFPCTKMHFFFFFLFFPLLFRGQMGGSL